MEQEVEVVREILKLIIDYYRIIFIEMYWVYVFNIKIVDYVNV